MKPMIAIYLIILTCGVTHSYSAKRRSAVQAAPMMPIYTQVSPQYYDNRLSGGYIPQQQYLSNPYQQQQQQQQQRIADEYNYRNSPNSNNFYYYPQQRQDYQEPLYGIPTYHGEYNPKPYYFAQPSFMSQDDRMETTNPLDYLHEEILQENERERNNAAFMQNLALYNKQLDSLQGRQQQLQQIEEMYNLKPASEFDDYDVIDQPSDWYDQTSILVDPNTYESYKSDYIQPLSQASPQYQYQQRSRDYDDEMVRELKELKQNRNKPLYKSWQQEMAQQGSADDDEETENYDDEWINWGGQKRSIQPKKDTQNEPLKAAKVAASTTSPQLASTSTEKSKIIEKLHKGQKEVVLPRPATPVRHPFSESVMKSMEIQQAQVDGGNENKQATPPIYKTIKQIIDMEQNLSHLSNNQLPTSKIRKRFVTNEETLAQQLNGLKRTSK